MKEQSLKRYARAITVVLQPQANYLIDASLGPSKVSKSKRQIVDDQGNQNCMVLLSRVFELRHSYNMQPSTIMNIPEQRSNVVF